MTNSEAIQYALDTANTLHMCARAVGSTTVAEQTLMGSLSVMLATREMDFEAMDPSIRELILFGSTARGDENPDDIDMMLFDSGFYSNVILTSSVRSTYEGVEGNFEKLLTGWFGFDEDHTGVLPSNMSVDLLVLPEQIFTDVQRFLEIANKQTDPNFFKKAFSKMQRYDAFAKKFIEIDLTYFEQKYGVSLSHLRIQEERLA